MTMPPSKPIKKQKDKSKTENAKLDTRTIILDTTEKLMRDEGYAAVSTRRVAKEAGLKPPLIHYYFSTTDDLFLAVFRHAADKELHRLTVAVNTEASLQSIWATYCNQNQTALAIEFMALANHRKAIKDEIAAMTERERRRRADLIALMIDTSSVNSGNLSPLGLNVLLIGVARTLVMEQGLGITLGHEDAKNLVEWGLQHLQKPAK